MTKKTDDTRPSSRVVLRPKAEPANSVSDGKPANPVSGGKIEPLEDSPGKAMRSLLEKGKMKDAMAAIADPESMVQLRRLISRDEKDNRVKWRAAQVFTAHCVERKEWDRVSHLLRSKDQAIREGVVEALVDAAKQEAQKLKSIVEKARSLLGGKDIAASKGAMKEISEAHAQEAHKLAIISGMISEAVRNGKGENSMRAAHALYRVIKQEG